MAGITFSTGDNTNKPAAAGSKIGSTIFYLFFAGIGAVVLVLFVWHGITTINSRQWPQVSCTIQKNEVALDQDEKNHCFLVRYAYDYAGKSYTSEVYQDGYSGSSDYGVAQRLSRKYPVGSRQICRVNPQYPSKAVLELNSLWTLLMILFPLPFIAIGVGGVYLTRRKNNQATTETLVASTPRNIRRYLFLFFIIFILAGLGMLIPFFILPMVHIRQAENWSPLPCRIISSSIRSHSNEDSTTYSVNILYSYRINGQEYRSNRYNFLGGSSSGFESKAKIIAQYPPGAIRTCFVNPSDPDDAVLERGYQSEMLFGLIPLVFFIVGVAGVLVTLLYGRKISTSLSADPSAQKGARHRFL